jgi:Fe-S-cluster containining protein
MEDPITDEWTTGTIEMTVGGIPIKMELTVPKTPVKPHRMLPIFQYAANAFVDISAQSAEAQGKTISCKAGCGACCSQAVPIAETEVYNIARVVEDLPEPRRTAVKERFAEAVRHFEERDWFGRMKATGEKAGTVPRDEVIEEIQALGLEYFHENIPCPFLEAGSCSIHPDRPIACREYLVTSPAENCSDPTAGTIDKVHLFVKTSDAVRTIGRTERFRQMGFIPLIKALELAGSYPESFVEKRGERWVTDLFAQLTRSEIPKKGVKPKARPLGKRRMKKRK